MENATVYLVIVLVPALAFLVPAQFFKLRAMVKARGRSSQTIRLLTIALSTVLASLAIGAVLGFVVLMGPSFVTGIGNDFLWLTMLPALGVCVFAATLASRVIGVALINRYILSSQVK